MKSNARLRNVYHNMLNYIQKRYLTDRKETPSETERKFIDILKTVIEGGYSIKEKEFIDILKSICVPKELTLTEISFFKAFKNIVKLKPSTLNDEDKAIMELFNE